MGLIREEYLREIREECIQEYGRDIPDEAWDKIVKDIEREIRERLEAEDTKKAIAEAFWTPLLERAEKGDLILKIDGVDIGEKIRRLKRSQNG